MRLPRLLRLWLIRLALGGLVLFVSVVLVYAIFQTPPAKRLLAKAASRSLSRATGQTIRVTGLTGLVPFRVHIASITVSDPDGEWFRLEGVRARLDVSSLLLGRRHLTKLEATSLILARPPKRTSPFQMPRLPATLFAMRADALHINTVTLGAAFEGKEMRFTADGAVTTGAKDRPLDIALDLRPLENTPASAKLAIWLEGDPARLGVDIACEAPGDGFMARSLRMPPDPAPFTLGVKGEGPLEDWRGTLSLARGAAPLLMADATLQGQSNILLGLTGTWEHPGLPAPLVKGAFTATAMLQPGKVIELPSLHLACPEGDVTLEGQYNLESREIRLTAHTSPISLTLLHKKASGQASLAVEMVGILDAPSLACTLTAETPGWEGFIGRAAVVQFNLPNVYQEKAVCEGDIKDLQRTLEPRTAALPIAWKVAISREGPDSPWLLEGEARPGDDAVTLSAQYLPALGAGLVSVNAPRLDLARFIPSFPCAVALESTFTAPHTTGDMGGHLSLQILEPGALPPSLTRFAQPGATVSTSLAYAITSNSLTFSDGVIAVPGLTGAFSGAYSLAEKKLAFDWTASCPEVKTLWPNAVGAAALHGRIEGPPDALTLKCDADSSRLTMGALSLDAVRLSAELTRKTRTIAGKTSLRASYEKQAIKADGRVALADGTVELTELGLSGAGVSAKGHLTITPALHKIEGILDAQAKDCYPIAKLFGQDISGAAKAHVALTPRKGDTDATATLTLSNVQASWGRASKVEAEGSLRDVFGARAHRLTANASNVAFGKLVLDTSSIESEDDGALRFRAGGDMAGETFRLKGKAIPAFKNGFGMGLSGCEGAWGDIPIRQKGAADIQIIGGQLLLQSLDVEAGEGRVTVRWASGKEGLDGAVGVEKIPLALFNASPWLENATIGGNLSVHGVASAPEASFNGYVDGLDPGGVQIIGNLRQGRATLQAVAPKLLEGPAEASLSIPVLFSVSPWRFNVDRNGSIEGKVSLQDRIEALTPYIPAKDQRFEGALVCDIAVAGSLTAPRFTGEASLTKGSYENLRSGTRLAQIEAHVEGTRDALRLTSFKATDGGHGGVTGEGELVTDATGRVAYTVRATMDKAVLVNRPDCTFCAESGSVELKGSGRKAALTGALIVTPGEFHSLRSKVGDMKGIEVRRGGLDEQSTEDATPLPGAPRMLDGVTLDVMLESPGRIYIWGPGLESVWRGKLQASGKASEPILNGVMQLDRGNFDMLGKRFAVREGELVFNGSWPPMPIFNLQGETKARDVVAHLSITGALNSLKASLSSDPALPDDEIMARVLFGQSAAKVNTAEAVELAAALRAMTAGGPTPLDRLRRAVGFDEFEVSGLGGEGDQKPVVGVGRYVGDKVYLKIEQSLGAEDSKARATVELAPNLSVEGYAGTDSGSGVSIKWQKDY